MSNGTSYFPLGALSATRQELNQLITELYVIVFNRDRDRNVDAEQQFGCVTCNYIRTTDYSFGSQLALHPHQHFQHRSLVNLI
jgi:hypothetical protein